jgi:hypothetical protein
MNFCPYFKKLFKLEGEGWDFAKNFRSVDLWSSKREEPFLKQNAFLTYSWMFLRSIFE